MFELFCVKAQAIEVNLVIVVLFQLLSPSLILVHQTVLVTVLSSKTGFKLDLSWHLDTLKHLKNNVTYPCRDSNPGPLD